MKILKTGHEIADIVAAALEGGLANGTQIKTETIQMETVPIGYGILRGTANVFRQSERNRSPWVHLDRGYWKPNHYDGYYRVSLNGTQQTIGLDKLEPDYARLESLNLDIKEWRGFDKSKPVLVIPPTQHVAEFFGINTLGWSHDIAYQLLEANETVTIRNKADQTPINFSNYNYVLTFNSSVGWQALQAGIPCVSDSTHSMVGKWFENISLENLSEAQYVDRHKLFAVMASLQLSLKEIKAGEICKLIERLLALSNH
jgi:hypothetical protein